MNARILKIALVALTMGVYTLTTAQITQQQWLGVVPAPGYKAMNVFVEVDDAKPVVLRLTDNAGIEVWKKSYPKSTVAQSIQLAALPAGTYYLSASKADEMLKYEITLTDHDVQVNYGTAQRLVKPSVNVDGNQVSVDYTVTKGAGKVYTRISEVSGRLLFERVLSEAERGRIRYDLAKLRPGQYVLDFQIGEKWFTHPVTISHEVAMR